MKFERAAEMVMWSSPWAKVTARQVAMYLVRNLTDYSYPAIARVFGNRDHTTVIHAVDKITGQMQQRRQIYEQVTELIQKVRAGT